jgi:hypothetical protein
VYPWELDLELKVARCLAEARYLALRLMVSSPESSQMFGTSFGQLLGCKVVGVHRLEDIVVVDALALLHWRRI